jgi:pyruvate/2-oxoglutarate dehydrogenase complex dihydrolipoamide dehydrogenase (E3) component
MRAPSVPHQLDDLERERFLHRVCPLEWNNPTPKSIYDLVVLGGGPAGLAAAEAAARLDLNVALVERHRVGGNSLTVGSVPSKAIIRSARIAAMKREGEESGVSMAAGAESAAFRGVMARMRQIRSRIAEYHSVERLTDQGIDIFICDARFIGRRSLLAGNVPVTFKKAIIATGARPKPPNIPGLDNTGYLTSSTIFDVTALPPRLAIIGGGPLGCELAQAFCRLGSRVTILQNDPKFLPNEERDAAELLSLSVSRDGVDTRLNTTVTGARSCGGEKFLEAANCDVTYSLPVDEILLSIGRVPNVEDLNLAAANIDYDLARGIAVDDFLRTTNVHVFAAGDVCMSHKFTNVAEATGRIAVLNAFGGRTRRRSHLLIPWCTHCDPEIAHVGMQVWEAAERGIPVKTFTIMMQDVDRAIIDGQDDGFVKLHIREGTDEIIGATIVASRASEMINEVSVLMSAGIGMRKLAHILHIYPAQADAIRLAAAAYMKCEGLRTQKRS